MFNSKNEKLLRQILRKFKLKILMDKILPQFHPWVSCEKLKSEICRLKAKTDLATIVSTFLDLLKNTDIKDEEIEEMIPGFMLLGIAYNSSLRTWVAYSLQGDSSEQRFEVELESDIKHHFLKNNLHAEVAVRCVEGIQWVRVLEKKLKRNVLSVKAPLYVAHFIGEPYLFLSKKEDSHETVLSLAEGLGYEDYKCSNLDGHDLESLLKHLNQKGVKRGYAQPIPAFNDFNILPCGKDFSQHTNRREFISNLMGPSPPKLSNYVVTAKNLPWKGKMNPPTMHSKRFDMKIEFKTDDTVEMLKDMAECGILKVPPPSYVVNLLSTGKNNIRLRVMGAQGTTDTDNHTDA